MAFDGLQTLSVDSGREGGGKSVWELLPSFEAGWSEDALSGLFERMPMALRNELLHGLRVLDGVKQARLRRAALPMDFEWLFFFFFLDARPDWLRESPGST